MYAVKEIYYTLQGEGHHTGRPAIFCRFAGCNLWTGREQDRDKAVCKFCDTDFWGTDGENGGKYTATQLADLIASLYPTGYRGYVVFTGGEPALQLDKTLVDILHEKDFEVAIETNGTLALAEGIDWICVSPKADTGIVVTKGHELKLVYPQVKNTPEMYAELDFEHFYLQPLDDTNWDQNTKDTIAYVKNNPKWQISTQTHKYLNIP